MLILELSLHWNLLLPKAYRESPGILGDKTELLHRAEKQSPLPLLSFWRQIAIERGD